MTLVAKARSSRRSRRLCRSSCRMASIKATLALLDPPLADVKGTANLLVEHSYCDDSSDLSAGAAQGARPRRQQQEGQLRRYRLHVRRTSSDTRSGLNWTTLSSARSIDGVETYASSRCRGPRRCSTTAAMVKSVRTLDFAATTTSCGERHVFGTSPGRNVKGSPRQNETKHRGRSAPRIKSRQRVSFRLPMRNTRAGQLAESSPEQLPTSARSSTTLCTHRAPPSFGK